MIRRMPVYEYACTSCGERTEAKQSFDDPPLEECPHCGGALRKLFSPVGIVFKGSGFYSTDAKKKAKASGSSDAGADSAAKTDSKDTKTDTKTESKPAAKGDGAAPGKTA
jgi:putative FmdB family regulatory protein